MKPIEAVARALCLAERLDPDEDWRVSGGVMLDVAVEHPERWRTYVRKAKASIAALADNISDEAVIAAKIAIGHGADVTDDELRRGFEAAIRALGKD